MASWIKVLVIVAALAMIAVVVQHQRSSAENDAWHTFAQTEDSVEALEDALPQVRDTSAEPWVAYALALRLYENGQPEDRERARQVAQEALERNADHPYCADWLRRLVKALDSFQPQG